MGEIFNIDFLIDDKADSNNKPIFNKDHYATCTWSVGSLLLRRLVLEKLSKS